MLTLSQQRAMPQTRWSQVMKASDSAAEAGWEALGGLLAAYRSPLIVHLISKYQLQPDQAEDLFQGFCEQRILTEALLSAATPEKGRFRNFLLRALDNYTLNIFRSQQARKRHPQGGVIPLDELEGAEPSSLDSDQWSIFDHEWALTVMTQAKDRMFNECRNSGRQDVWGVFSGRILKPLIEGCPVVQYPELVSRFALKSPDQAGNILITGKRMFLRCLNSVLEEYVQNPEQREEELRALVKALTDPRFNPSLLAKLPPSPDNGPPNAS